VRLDRTVPKVASENGASRERLDLPEILDLLEIPDLREKLD